jgi:excisionase family DNA binding protein
MDEITAAQAANLTGLSERTIRRKIASGVLPARRMGRNRFAIKVTDLQVRHPWEALAARIESLEQRLDRLEESLRILGSLREASQPASDAAPGPAGPIVSAEVQQLFAQLAYETARLARAISLPEMTTSGSVQTVTLPAVDGPAASVPATPASSKDLQRDEAV